MSPSAVELMLLDEYPAVPSSIAERYKVGRTLGDGNFAVVRECMERSTGREYALKIINKDKCRGKVRHLDCTLQGLVCFFVGVYFVRGGLVLRRCNKSKYFFVQVYK